jgi:hypothetical protein
MLACRFLLRQLILIMDKYQNILGFFLVLGLALTFFCVGFVKILRIMLFRRRSEKTTGIITQFENVKTKDVWEDDEEENYPVIQFHTRSGVLFTLTYFVPSRFYAVGDKVKVHYDPLDPAHFIVDDVVSALSACLLTLLGLLFIIVLILLH